MKPEIYRLALHEINRAYEEKNRAKIEKETCFVLYQVIVKTMWVFKEEIASIFVEDIQEITFKESFILSDENHKSLLGWLDRINELNASTNPLELKNLKKDLEEWYDRISGKGIQFNYR